MKPKNPQGGPDRPSKEGGGGIEREREPGGREPRPSEGADVETGGESGREDQPAEEEIEE